MTFAPAMTSVLLGLGLLLSPVGAQHEGVHGQQRDGIPCLDSTIARGMLSGGGRDKTVFVPNGGQWPGEVRFWGRTSLQDLWIGDDWLLFTPAMGRASVDNAVRFSFESTAPGLARDEGPRPGAFNFFLGDDPSRWAMDLPCFERVLLPDLSDGLSAEVTSDGNAVSFRLHVPPATDVSSLLVKFEGGRLLRADADGSLTVDTAAGQRGVLMLRAWGLSTDTVRYPLPIVARLVGPLAFGVDIPGRDNSEPVEIEADFQWASHLGGTLQEQVSGVGFAPDGDVIVAGNTNSPDYPITPGAFDPVIAPSTSTSGQAGMHEIFVTRLSADGGELVYSTFLGGEKGESASAVVMASDGSVVIAGQTNSPDFPTPPGGLSISGSGPVLPVFVTRLSANGNGLEFTAMLGGSGLGVNEPRGIAIDDEDRVIVCGSSGQAGSFPVTSDAAKPIKSGSDGFLFRLSADGSTLDYSSYFGADMTDDLLKVSVSPTGDVVFAGRVFDLATTAGAYNPNWDSVFIARFAPDLKTIKASTYFGGNSSEIIYAIAFGPQDEIFVVGETLSDNLPVTPEAFQKTSACAICGDGFVTCFGPMLTSLIYSTYVAGALATPVWALHVDGGGVATVAGTCTGPSLPTTPGAIDTTWNGKDDLFVLRLSPDGSKAWYATYYGGTQHDGMTSTWPVFMDVDETGSVVLASTSNSPDFPTTAGSLQPSKLGTNDGIVVRLALLPAGAAKYGASTPGCHGPLAIGVTAMPQVGSVDVALTCTGAPPLSTSGLVAVSLGALPAPVVAVGAQAWIDPSRIISLLPAGSNPVGLSLIPLRMPDSAAAAGLQAFLQFFWKDPCGPSGWSASNALQITVQP